MTDPENPPAAINTNKTNTNKKGVTNNGVENATQTPALPNSLRLKTPNSANSRQNMSSILQRLPLLRALTETQNSTQSLTPIWLTWCEHQHKARVSLALKLDQHASPTSLRQGSLNIACNNAAVASLIKHQLSSLLKAFHDAGLDHIKQIHVQMELAQTTSKPSRNSDTDQKSTVSDAKTQRIAPPSSAIKSIEATQSLIDNEQLAASLKRLAHTLRSSSE